METQLLIRNNTDYQHTAHLFMPAVYRRSGKKSESRIIRKSDEIFIENNILYKYYFLNINNRSICNTTYRIYC